MTAFQAHPWIESISSREYEVLTLVSNGLSNREIAQKLHLSIETVKWYNRQMFMKLGVSNRIQAVNKAAELNLLDSDQRISIQDKKDLPGNLPAQLTSYVGRDEEVREIKELLLEHRLVVLTGAGGSGKTRLALKVGEEMQFAYRDGVWFVELANLLEPPLVLGAIANALNITENANIPLDDIVKRYLKRRHLLLLIDNMEHLMECAPLIGDLLAAVSELSVLVTSRERLHIYGEQEYPVHPLDLPSLVENRASEELMNVESISLFLKRAMAAKPDLSLDKEALKEIARICVRLDGLPLAIELCAPMVKVFPLEVIAERIDKGLDAIPNGPRDLPTRQQTLRDTIQWSFDLLTESEKILFVRMAVFSGGGKIQAVEAICGDGISGNIGNILSGLVNKNMALARERGDGEIHFGLLETIKQFSYEKLLTSGEAEVLADRHAEYFKKLAEQASIELRGPDQIFWMESLITVNNNMRTALEHVIQKCEIGDALNFTCNLYEFWWRHSDFEEGRLWIEQAMALPNARQKEEQFLETLNRLSWLTWFQNKDAISLAEQVIPSARSQPNKKIYAEALINLGLMLVRSNDDFSKGQAYLKESIDLSREIQAEWELARAIKALATAHFLKKEYNEARSLYYESFNLFKKLGDIYYQGVVKQLIGNLEIMLNNLGVGLEAYRESLMIARLMKSNLLIGFNVLELARVAKSSGNHVRFVQLFVAGNKIFEDIGAWSSGDESELEEALAIARNELSKQEFQSTWEMGQSMGLEDVIEYALSYASDG